MKRRPLELVVYEKEPGRYGREALYNSPDGLWAYPASHADGYAQAKRLTDAELAAEHWRAKYSGVMAQYGGLSDENREKIRTVERFYLAPHYDDPETTTP